MIIYDTITCQRFQTILTLFDHCEYLQKPHNAGSRREARFFNTLLGPDQPFSGRPAV